MSSDDFFEACRKGDIARVRQAVAEGVDVTKAVDKRRKDFTPLHYACQNGHAAIASFLLQEAHCDPNCVSRDGRTSLTLTDDPELIRLLLRNGAKPNSCFPSHLRYISPDHAFKMFFLGSPCAGKSTLVKALRTEGQGFSRFVNRITKVTDVDVKTAGIIPHDIHSKVLGHMTLYDFAGHKEYYAGHDALLHNTISSSLSIIALMVDLRDEEGKIRETLQYWLQFTSYHSSEGKAKPHLLIIGSHADNIPHSEVNLKSRILESVINSSSIDSITFSGSIAIDCRYAESPSMTKLRSMISQICQASRSSDEITPAYHSFLVFLLDKFRENIAVSFSDATAELGRNLDSDKHIYLECLKSSDPFEMCEKLNERGNILFMKNNKQPYNSWIVLDKATLLSQVNGIIFAPEGFKERCTLSTSTGVVPLSKLCRVFPKLNPDMITKFLCHLEFCHEITDEQLLFLLSSVNESYMIRYERFFFFPGLVSLHVPQNVFKSTSNYDYNSGWVLQCSKSEQFFSNRFLQVLLLRLAFSFALASTDPSTINYIAIQRRCDIWKNGISWGNLSGSKAIIEIINLRQVVVIVHSRFKKIDLVRLRSAIINSVIDAKEEFCPTVLVRESLILPEDAAAVYPLDPSKLTGINITEVAASIAEGKKLIELEKLVCFEPYACMGQSLLQRIFSEDITVSQVVTDDLLVAVAIKCSQKSVDEYFTIFEQEIASHEYQSLHGLLQIFKQWRDRMGMEGTLKNFKKKLDQFSVFAGRNPLKLITTQGLGNDMNSKLQLLCDPTNQLFGDSVTLIAIADGLNDVSYRWLKNDVLLSPARDPAYTGLRTSRLTIFPFTHDYEGKYKCIISSKGGEVIESTIVELNLGGHALNNEELTVLQQLHGENVMKQLMNEGLKLQGKITIEEVKYYLKVIGMEDKARYLKENLEKFIKYTKHYKLLQQAMSKGLQVPLKFLKFVFFGPPGAGKTTFMRRLIGEIEKIDPDSIQPSTLTADQKELMIKLFNKILVINTPVSTNLTSEWCSITEEEGGCSLDEEALMILHFINDREFNLSQHTSDQLSQAAKSTLPSPSPESIKASSTTMDIQELNSSDILQSVQPLNVNLSNESAVSLQVQTEIDSNIHDQGQPLPLKPTFLERYRKIIDAWKILFAQSKYDQVTKILSQSVLVNVMDVGGQPPFLEMVPALAHGPGLYLICFNLQNEVDKRYEAAYIADDRKRYELQYSYSVLEVLFQCLSSMACFSPMCSLPRHTAMPPSCKAAVIVGTHKDKLKGDDTVIDRVENRIQTELSTLLTCDRVDEQDYHKNLCMYDGRVLTAVDNTCGIDEIQGHRDHIEQIIRDKFYSASEFKIPASWLMFSILLRKIDKKILSIHECQQIAQELGIQKNDLKLVLLYLHHDIGIIMYYASDEVKGLDEDVVISQPQVVFKSIGDLILNVFLPERCRDDRIRKTFWEKGQFNQEDIEKSITADDNADQLSPKQLISILQHLNVLVQLIPNVFFMPAVMKAAPKHILDQYKHHNAIAPLLIRFKCVFVPIGCFAAMIAQLVCDQRENNWRLSQTDDLYKDMVTFILPGNFKVILISHPKRYEVHLSPIPNRKNTRSVEYIASDALKTVCGALDTVLKKLREQYTSPDLTIYNLGFFCCCNGLTTPNKTYTCAASIIEHTPGSAASIPNNYEQYHVMLINNKSIGENVARCIEDSSEVLLQPAHLVWNGSHKFGTPSIEPGNLNVIYEYPRSAEISWTPIPIEQQNSFIIGYTIQVVESDSDSIVREVLVEGADANSIGIHKLNPLISYTFNISAKTKTGSVGPKASISFEESVTLDGLTIKDLNNVKNAIWSACSKWYNLGLELGILADTLDVIRENYRNCEDCHIEMLKRWLRRRNPRPTWSILAKALNSPPVDEGALAEQLPKKK